MINQSYILCFLCFLCTSISGQIPTFDWATMVALNEHSGWPKRSTIDSAGNIYSCAGFTGSIDVNPGSDVYELSLPGHGFYVSKLDKDGNFVFAKAFTASVATLVEVDGLAVTDNGEVYMTGRFSGEMDADPGPNTYMLSATSSSTPFYIKLAANGALEWAFSLEILSFSGMESRNLSIDREGNLVASGFINTNASVDFDPGAGSTVLSTVNLGRRIFVSKYTSEGAFIWATLLGSTNEIFSASELKYDVAIDSFNNMFISSQTDSTSDFDSGPDEVIVEASLYLPVGYICKLNAEGHFQWVQTIQNHTPDIAFDILVLSALSLDPWGNILVTGHFGGLFDFDPGPDTFHMDAPMTPSPEIHYEVFILKLDPNGQFLWARHLGQGGTEGHNGDSGYAVKTDQYGNVYTTGSKRGTGDYDPGPNIYNLEGVIIQGTSHGQAFLSKLDRDGNFVWASQIEPSETDYFSCARDIELDKFGNIHTHGYFRGENDFDPGEDVFYLDPSTIAVQEEGHYTLKLKQCLLAPQIEAPIFCMGQETQITASLLDTLPIPVYAEASYLWSTGASSSSISITPTVETTYTVTITDANACEYVREVAVSPLSPPTANIIAPEEGCPNDFVLLEGEGEGSYLWSNGDSIEVATVEVLTDAVHYLTVTADNGCTAIDSLMIDVLHVDDVFVSEDTMVCPGGQFTLYADGGESYVWSTGDTGPEITTTIHQDDVYYVTITDWQTCTLVDTIWVLAGQDYCPPCPILPNAFTPDGDGFNDLFYPVKGVGFEVLEFRVYNRWGNLVYDDIRPWNGQYKGKPQASDVYLYQILLESHCGTESYSGDVTLIR